MVLESLINRLLYHIRGIKIISQIAGFLVGLADMFRFLGRGRRLQR